MFTVIIVVCSLKNICVPSFIEIGYCVSELHGHTCICRSCNVLPEAVYCCFTRTTLFTKLFTCLYDQSLRLLSHHQALLLYTLWFLRYNVAKCIARGCLFTINTLFTIHFLMIAITSPSFVTLYLMVSEIAKYIA